MRHEGAVLFAFALSVMAAPCLAQRDQAAQRMAAPKDASVYFIEPRNGQIVGPHVHVVFGTRNFGVGPAGTDFANTGHHHVLIDTALPPLDEPIPSDRSHQHFGAGQTETVIDLPPGRHTLQLLMGDGNHVPHNPPVLSKPIIIFVRR
jgi:Domain of unknown function (DUF4399)